MTVAYSGNPGPICLEEWLCPRKQYLTVAWSYIYVIINHQQLAFDSLLLDYISKEVVIYYTKLAKRVGIAFISV